MKQPQDVPSLSDLPVSPERLVEESPNGWLLVDTAGRIVFANARAFELFDYPRDALLGQQIELLVPEQFRHAHVQHRAGYMRAPIMRPMGLGLALTARRRDGSEFPVEISLSPMVTPTGTYVTTIVRDMTEQAQLIEDRNNLRLELEMERERDRIGMDLHDGIMQEIYAAGLTLEIAIADVHERPDVAEAAIERSIDQLHEVIRNIRSYIFDLRPRQFAGSLSGALSELVREFHQNTQIAVRHDIPDLPDVDMEAASAAYHIVHEALSNVRKHSDASQVAVALTVEDGHVNIEVNDNGRGFDAGAGRPQVHRGLRNMEARARNAGCRLTVESTPGVGTRITVQVPLKA